MWVQSYLNPLFWLPETFYQQNKWSYYFSKKCRYSDLFYWKKNTLHLLPFVLLQSHLLLCWHGLCDVIVQLCNGSVTLSKYIIDVHPRSDSAELAEAVPIDFKFVKTLVSVIWVYLHVPRLSFIFSQKMILGSKILLFTKNIFLDLLPYKSSLFVLNYDIKIRIVFWTLVREIFVFKI